MSVGMWSQKDMHDFYCREWHCMIIAASAIQHASHRVVICGKALKVIAKVVLRLSFCITHWHLALQLSFKNPNQAGEAYIHKFRY